MWTVRVPTTCGVLHLFASLCGVVFLLECICLASWWMSAGWCLSLEAEPGQLLLRLAEICLPYIFFLIHTTKRLLRTLAGTLLLLGYYTRQNSLLGSLSAVLLPRTARIFHHPTFLLLHATSTSKCFVTEATIRSTTRGGT